MRSGWEDLIFSVDDKEGDLIKVFKILNRYYEIEPTVFFTINNSSTTRGHQFKLFTERSRLLIRQHFFTNRVVNLWNSLPSSIVLAPTIAAFKQRLDDIGTNQDMGILKGLQPSLANCLTRTSLSIQLHNQLIKIVKSDVTS